MSKAELITWLAGLAEDSDEVGKVDAIRCGVEPEGDWLTLKEVAGKVRKHYTWLWKLRVPEVCGERLGGRRAYKLARVEEYLMSDACQERIAELNAERRRRERVRHDHCVSFSRSE